MAKKVIYLLGLILILGLPLFLVFSQEEGPQACCRLIRDFTNVNSACRKGAIVGNRDEGPCSLGEPTKVDEWGLCCTLNAVAKVTNYIFYFFMLLAVAFGIYAAFLFLTAGGEEEKIKKARATLLYIVIAIVVAVLARFLPTFVSGILR